MMNKYFKLLVITALLLSAASCHTSKRAQKKEYNQQPNPTDIVDLLLDQEEYQDDNKGNGGIMYKIFKMGKNDNKKLYDEASKWLGVPYEFGAQSYTSTDCSGMVYEIYKKVYGIKLERNSARMMERNCRPIDVDDLSEGDLVFFSFKKNRAGISHVGLYLKDRKFIQATVSRGVIISSIDDETYRRRLIQCGRVNARDR